MTVNVLGSEMPLIQSVVYLQIVMQNWPAVLSAHARFRNARGHRP